MTEGKFIFVGDECQLPPVGQDISPALSPDYFKQTFNIDVVECKLTQCRQQADNNYIRRHSNCVIFMKIHQM